MKTNVIHHYNLPVSSLHTSHGLIHSALVKPHDLQTVIITILQIKKLRLSEIMQLRARLLSCVRARLLTI